MKRSFTRATLCPMPHLLDHLLGQYADTRRGRSVPDHGGAKHVIVDVLTHVASLQFWPSTVTVTTVSLL